MIAATISRVTAVSAILTAIAGAIATLIGWVVFVYFGAITMVVLFIVLNSILTMVFAGMVVGSLAVAQEREHPLSVAIASGTLLCIAIMLIAPDKWSSDLVRVVALIIPPVAGVRAWRLTRLRSNLA